jgi:hypothetical protein
MFSYGSCTPDTNLLNNLRQSVLKILALKPTVVMRQNYNRRPSKQAINPALRHELLEMFSNRYTA